jgi:hypothetical protein
MGSTCQREKGEGKRDVRAVWAGEGEQAGPCREKGKEKLGRWAGPCGKERGKEKGQVRLGCKEKKREEKEKREWAGPNLKRMEKKNAMEHEMHKNLYFLIFLFLVKEITINSR